MERLERCRWGLRRRYIPPPGDFSIGDWSASYTCWPHVGSCQKTCTFPGCTLRIGGKNKKLIIVKTLCSSSTQRGTWRSRTKTSEARRAASAELGSTASTSLLTSNHHYLLPLGSLPHSNDQSFYQCHTCPSVRLTMTQDSVIPPGSGHAAQAALSTEHNCAVRRQTRCAKYDGLMDITGRPLRVRYTPVPSKASTVRAIGLRKVQTRR